MLDNRISDNRDCAFLLSCPNYIDSFLDLGYFIAWVNCSYNERFLYTKTKFVRFV